MKKIMFWSIMMLMVVILPMMVACSSDSDDNGSSIDLTAEEIKEILTGKWEVYGEYNWTITHPNHYPQEKTGKYEGTIHFYKNKDIKTNGIPVIAGSLNDYYNIKKKNGKNYLLFIDRNREIREYEIVSLTKTTFRLVCNEDINDKKDGVIGHVYMTMISN